MNSLSLEVPDIAFFGRSLAEYQTFLALDAASLAGRRVLDCAAGPSSFAAEAACCGVEVVAVDPLYNRRESALRRLADAALHRMFAQIRAKPHLVVQQTFASIDAAEADRRRAVARFLTDYYTGVAVGRYVAGALPSLPFGDATFDLAICAHLLFVYEQFLDLAFHLAACRELVRVSRGEVRIHPLVDLAGAVSPLLGPVRAGLAACGIGSEIVETSHGFFRGATQTMILRPSHR